MKNCNTFECLLENLISEYKSFETNLYFVFIGGCSRSGKTTLVKMLCSEFHERNIESIVFSLDNYLLGIKERSGKETVRERYNYKQIELDLQKIKQGDKISPPFYDAKTRSVLKSKKQSPLFIKKGICVVEGVVALDLLKVNEWAMTRVFVEVEDNIRLNRLNEFYTEFKGLSHKEAKRIIDEREIEEVSTVKETKKNADYIFSENI
ncbi:MAG: hypothetical protein A2Y03_04940 [Omnitrophica WOR_2 bacterium GWF2_38_59]|nr:MAG: hypothetical protein A2Y03_04940 [Omnitrophica WOR_2 bacterium GWF2_38_59]OGX48270.1 MAG: hypothetical protein A2243_10350 [Omnitrophica WOR_2 bacterium RIFOXYA2_FULL_38_17]OGX59957.1 MAG: hypothetical protein A2306_04485 [Omnitrophica WOR_2 bacterium RIFOXYB2_FULL_38_16]